MINFIICLSFTIIVILFTIIFVFACIFWSIEDSTFYYFSYLLCLLFIACSVFCIFECIDAYNSKCPVCDVFCFDNYCSSCGTSMNHSFVCSCGSTYDFDSIPNFCSDCGSPIRSD